MNVGDIAPPPASGEREGPADPRIKSGEEGEGQQPKEPCQ